MGDDLGGGGGGGSRMFWGGRGKISIFLGGEVEVLSLGGGRGLSFLGGEGVGSLI